MNTDHIDHMIAMLTAYKEGKIVERRFRYHQDSWSPVTASTNNWDFNLLEYRVKPEPRTMWVNFYQDGSSDLWDLEECAHYNASHSGKKRISCKKYVEVIEG